MFLLGEAFHSRYLKFHDTKAKIDKLSDVVSSDVKILVVLLLVCALAGCSSRAKPPWVYEPYRDYDPDRFIVGVGFGNNPNQADDSARHEILKQIKSQIKSIIEQKTKAEMKVKGGKEDVLLGERLFGRIRTIVEGEIKGVQINQRYEDKEENMWYSLAVFDKVSYAKKMRKVLLRKELEINEILKRVEQDITNGEIFGAVSKLREADRISSEIEPEIEFLSLISDEFIPDVRESIKERFASLNDLISIQVDEPERTFSEPFTVVSLKVMVKTKNERAVKNFPLIVKPDSLLFGTEIFAVTDEMGIANLSFPMFIHQRNKIELRSGIPELRVVADAYVSSGEKARVRVFSNSEAIRSFLSTCLLSYGVELASDTIYTISVTPSVKIEKTGKDFRGNPFHIVGIYADLIAQINQTVVLKTIRYAKGGGSSPEESLKLAFRNLLSSICKGTEPLQPDEYIFRLLRQK